ncbi:MAG: hypothetical protein CR997_05495 [Acidobacteria bacterium]|nr:MAG: hypothetical protein CR997_05495 [Acidobacteriota bacterium]
MSRYERVFLTLAGLFLTCLIISNVLVFKFLDIPMPVVGRITISVGLLPYPVTFLVTDLISELYGRKRANFVVYLGFFLSVFMLFILYVGKIVPLAAIQDPVIQEHYVAAFGKTTKAVLASMTAYLIAQLIDIRIFHFWKKLTGGRHLWLRNNGSTLISQLIDTVLVVTILFGGEWTVEAIIHVIISSYCFKLLVALLDTPLFYAGVFFFKDIEEETGKNE